MSDECPARLSFPTAPYLDLQCTEPPGHHPGTLHRAKTRVRAALVPYDEHSRTPPGKDHHWRHPSLTSAAVFMQWAQDTAQPADDAAAVEGGGS